MQDLSVQGEFITLAQLLKVVGAVDSGGQVKEYLSRETPIVNGEPETRRGRKLRPGDVIDVPGIGKVRCVEAQG